jgi:hypothetical protein
MANLTDLTPGDRIEIRYRTSAGTSSNGDELRDKWIAAEIRSVDGGIWPLARLADGQWTEVRRYMEWRYASSHLRTPRPHPRSA